MEIEERLKDIIIKRLNLDIKPEDIDNDQPLFEGAPGSLGLDSVEALDLVVGIEEEFKVRVEAEEGVAEKFFSVTTLAELVRDIQAKQTKE